MKHAGKYLAVNFMIFTPNSFPKLHINFVTKEYPYNACSPGS